MIAQVDIRNAFLSQIATGLGAGVVEDIDRKLEFFDKRLGYHPFKQQLAVHTSEARFKVVRTAKQSGKSTLEWAEACYQATLPGVGGWIASDSHELADRVFSEVWMEIVGNHLVQVLHKDRRTLKMMYAHGGFFKGRTWENIDSLEADALHYMLCDEFQKANQRIFELLLARLSLGGGWMILTGSPEWGYPFFDDMWDMAHVTGGWEAFTWGRVDNPATKPELVEDARKTLSPEAFAELWEGKPRPPKGLVHPEFDIMVHVSPQTYEHGVPVEVWIDPGYGGHYAVEFVQVRGKDVHVLDEVYVHQMHAEEVILLCKENALWPYVVAGVQDIAGKQHHEGESNQEIWRAKANIHLRSQFVPIQAGIDRYSTILIDPATKKPRIHIDPKCKGLIMEHRGYKFRESNDGVYSKNPMDRNNHAIKAIVYGCVDHFGFSDRDMSAFTSILRTKTGNGAVHMPARMIRPSKANSMRGY